MDRPPPPLLGPLVTTDSAAAIFSDQARLQGMLDFEAALARAEAATGVIPPAAAPAIAAEYHAARFDIGEIGRAAARAGNPAIPLVRRLTELVAANDPEAARFVHWGATSQDAMDTGLVLQLRVFVGVIESDLARLSRELAGLAERHQDTVMVGRTWLQRALPITFGLKAAGWLDGIERHRRRLAELRPRLLVLQFGAAAGTLAALGAQAPAVAAALARMLDLTDPAMPWHGQRDRLAELATALGLLGGTLGKIARDIALLMQTNVAEAFELTAPGRGGSSTMPHKRNPVAAAAVLAAAARLPDLGATILAAQFQEHERGLGGWQAEWETLPQLCLATAGALRQTADIVAGLEIDTARMGANLKATKGLILAEAVTMALGAAIGRLPAHELVEQACRVAAASGRHLIDMLSEIPDVTRQLTPDQLARLCDPAGYTGQATRFVTRVLAERDQGQA